MPKNIIMRNVVIDSNSNAFPKREIAIINISITLITRPKPTLFSPQLTSHILLSILFLYTFSCINQWLLCYIQYFLSFTIINTNKTYMIAAIADISAILICDIHL